MEIKYDCMVGFERWFILKSEMGKWELGERMK